MNDGLARWHAYMAAPSRERLKAMLAGDAVFHSPVVHSPQRGRDLAFAYLDAASGVLGNASFEYVREIASGDQAMLEFTAELEGIHVNGVDIIRWNEEGLIQDFKVMVRPLKAIHKLRELMGAQLERAGGQVIPTPIASPGT